MKYTARPYQSPNDLYQIGKLIRRAYARHKYLNAWSFCRYDLWALRRLADAGSFNDHSWQEYFQLLQDANEALVGAAFACDNHPWRKTPEPYALILDPDHAQTAKYLIDWAESSGMFEVEILQGNTFLNDLLDLRGYTRSHDSMIIREKVLADTPPEEVSLPPGYSIRVIDPPERSGYFEALLAAHPLKTREASASLPLTSANAAGLHLQVLDPQEQIAAYCSVWFDTENNMAEFEPVGILSQFQAQGLETALLAYACNRLREINCARVTAAVWSRAIGANRQYAACGLLEHSHLYSWRKDSR